MGSMGWALSWLIVLAVGLAPMLVYWLAGDRARDPALSSALAGIESACPEPVGAADAILTQWSAEI